MCITKETRGSEMKRTSVRISTLSFHDIQDKEFFAQRLSKTKFEKSSFLEDFEMKARKSSSSKD